MSQRPAFARPFVSLLLTAALLPLAACSDKDTPQPAATGAAQPAQPAQPARPAQPAQPAQPAEPVGGVQPVQPIQPIQPIQPVQPVQPVQPATQGSAAPMTGPVLASGSLGTPAPGQQLALDAQASSPAGLTVRVKGVEMGTDATVLSVSASFSSRMTGSTKLAFSDSYLDDGKGTRLMIKRPEDNGDLNIRSGETMEGQLVFLGSVPAGATQLQLVLNDGNNGDNLIGPGMRLTLPLKPGNP